MRKTKVCSATNSDKEFLLDITKSVIEKFGATGIESFNQLTSGQQRGTP